MPRATTARKVATDAAAIADAVRSRARRRRARAACSASIDLGLFGEGTPGLRGDLRVVPLAEVLQLLDVQEQSGVLTVERSGARVDIYFRRGRVDQAVADGVPDEFLLGRFVARRRADVAHGLRVVPRVARAQDGRASCSASSW